MYVGVILYPWLEQGGHLRVPHVCGGDPKDQLSRIAFWRVFPMYVGVILMFGLLAHIQTSVPHVCGGDPEFADRLEAQPECSPCMWG